METGGEVRDRETDGGDEDTKRKRRRRRRTRNEEEGTRSLRVLAVYFVIAGAYAGINVTNFDDLHAHTHTVTPSVSFCRRGCRPFFTDRMRAERIDHGIKSSSIYQYPKRDRYKGDDPNRHQSRSHFCSARAIPLVHMIYASRDSRAGRYRFIFTPSPRASLSHSLLFRRDRRRSLLIPPISVPLLLLPPPLAPPSLLPPSLPRSRTSLSRNWGLDRSLPFSIPRPGRSRRNG